jgi:hypothetical protein
MTSDQIRAEEEKRERHWEPGVRWRILQETIAWAADQSSVKRNSIEARLTEQNRKLAWFTEYRATHPHRRPT